MNLKQKKKQLVAAAMAVLLSVGTAVPAVIASAPAVYAADITYTDASGTCFTIYTDGAHGHILGITPGRNVTELVVPRSINGITVTGFGASHHYYDDWTGCEAITSITFPDTVTRIEGYAFGFWTSLSDITLPKNLTYIGDSAFVGTAYYTDKNNWQNGCLYLDNWLIGVNDEQFPNGVCTVRNNTIGIAELTFWYCERVREIHLPNSLQYLEDQGFLNCTNLKDIYYNSSQADWLKLIANKEVGILPSTTLHYNNPVNTPTPTTPTQTTPTTNTKGSIMLDTANYIMAPGNIYDIGVTIKDPSGNKLTANQVQDLVSSGKLKVQDSRTGSIANLQQLPNGNFRVTGKNVGTCYIVYDIGGTHASVRIDVQNGVKQHGTAVRHTSFFTQDVDFSREYYAEDFIGMTYGELVAKFGTNYIEGWTEYTAGGGRPIKYPQLPGMSFVFSEVKTDSQGNWIFENNEKIAGVYMTDSGKINPTLRANFNLAQLESAAKNLKNATTKSERYYVEMDGRGNCYSFSIQLPNVLIIYEWYFGHGASLSGPASNILVMPN